MSEKLCLQWNDFKDNLIYSVGALKNDSNFTDVTLACEDGTQVEAHKVILASSSPFFQNLLSRNKHTHPLIYMRGVKSKDLLAIFDFLYCGEANVFQENLDSFLAIADELKLKGLMGGQVKDVEKKTKSNSTPQMNMKPFVNREMSNLNGGKSHSNLTDHPSSEEINIERRIAIPNFVSGDLKELDEKVKSLMEKSQNILPNRGRRADICKVCGKEGEGIAIRDHIEANHLEGVSLPCNVCEKTFRSRIILRRHKCTS